MRKVFIAYRRDDTSMAAGRLQGDLEQHFGAAVVFRDKEAIRGGERWAERIRKEIGRDTLMLVLIGPHWLEAKDTLGHRRLDNAADAHRQEIEIALAQGATLIPVLVENTVLPPAEKLPGSLQALPQHQVLKLRDDDWNNDFSTLKDHMTAAGLKPLHSGARRSYKAIAALMLGLFALSGFSQDPSNEDTMVGIAAVSAVALVLGVLAWQDARQQRTRGPGVAISAFIVGLIGLLGAIGNLMNSPVPSPSVLPETLVATPQVNVTQNPLQTLTPPKVSGLNLTGEWRDGLNYPVSIQQAGAQISMYSAVTQVQLQGTLTGLHIEGAFYPAAGGMQIGTGAFDVDPGGGAMRGMTVIWGQQPTMVVLVRAQ